MRLFAGFNASATGVGIGRNVRAPVLPSITTTSFANAAYALLVAAFATIARGPCAWPAGANEVALFVAVSMMLMGPRLSSVITKSFFAAALNATFVGCDHTLMLTVGG